MSGTLAPNEVAAFNRLDTKRPVVPFPWPCDWDLWEAVQIFGVGAYGWMLWNTFPEWFEPLGTITLPWGWEVPAFAFIWGLLTALCVANIYVKVDGKPMAGWLWPALRHLILLWVANKQWGGVKLGVIGGIQVQGRKPGRWDIHLPPDLGRVIHANAVVESDGTINVAGLPGKLGWLASVARRKEPKRRWVEVRPTGATELQDMDEQQALLLARQGFYGRIDHDLTTTLRVRPMPPDYVRRIAGPSGIDAAERLAPLLIQRRIFIAVPGATSGILRKRVRKLLPALADGGLEGWALDANAANDLLDTSWGKNRKPLLGITPTSCILGGTEYVTWELVDVKSALEMGWPGPFTSGVLLSETALSTSPKHRRVGEMMISWRRKLWSGLSEATRSDAYSEAIDQATDVLALLRRGQGRLMSVALNVTVPANQLEDAEDALDSSPAEWRIPRLRAEQARKSTIGLGVGSMNYLTTHSNTVATFDMFSTGGLTAGPAQIMIGVSGRSPELVCWDATNEEEENWSLAILGMMGSGKTTIEGTICLRLHKPQPDHPLAADPPRVYVAYAKAIDDWKAVTEFVEGLHVKPKTWAEFEAAIAAWKAEHDGEWPQWVAVNLIELADEAMGQFLLKYRDWVIERQAEFDFLRPAVFALDEAWLLARTRSGAAALELLGRQARGLFLIVIAASQQVEEMMKGPAAAFIKNSAAQLLLKQTPMARMALQRDIGLGPMAMSMIMQAGKQKKKGRGVFRAAGQIASVDVILLSPEDKLFETNPQQRARAVKAAIERETKAA